MAYIVRLISLVHVDVMFCFPPYFPKALGRFSVNGDDIPREFCIINSEVLYI